MTVKTLPPKYQIKRGHPDHEAILRAEQEAKKISQDPADVVERRRKAAHHELVLEHNRRQKETRSPKTHA